MFEQHPLNTNFNHNQNRNFFRTYFDGLQALHGAYDNTVGQAVGQPLLKIYYTVRRETTQKSAERAVEDCQKIKKIAKIYHKKSAEPTEPRRHESYIELNTVRQLYLLT